MTLIAAYLGASGIESLEKFITFNITLHGEKMKRENGTFYVLLFDAFTLNQLLS